jgi:hypothetical protein
MRIEPKHNVAGATKLSPTGNKLAHIAKTDHAEFAASDNLMRKLDETTEVRAEAVARAKALVADPSYPNDSTVRKVARVLAQHLSSPPNPK